MYIIIIQHIFLDLNQYSVLIFSFTFLFVDNIQSDSLKRQFIICEDENENADSSSQVFDISKSINSKKIKPNLHNVINISKNVKGNINSKVTLQPNIIVNELGAVRDEKNLRLIKLREAIDQQRELHVIKLKIADAELKIALLKLSLAEENVQMQSEATIIAD